MYEEGIQILSYAFYGIIYFSALKVFIGILIETIKQFVPSSWVGKYGLDKGKWVVVTGATDGIGLGFVEELAFNGCNVMLISRNEQKIKKRISQLKETLLKKDKKIPSFKYIVADFKNSSDEKFIPAIIEQLKGLEISILINNVGTSQTIQIEQYEVSKIVEIINVNCTSMATLTSAMIPILDSKSAAIINLSSFLGQNSAPYVALYSATKAFNTFFSEGISMQKQLKHIDILSVRPMFVESPLSKAKKGLFVPDRRQCGRACMRQLRWEYETNGYYIHRIVAILSRVVPKFINRIVSKSSLAQNQIKLRRPD